jgi:hypothetical protein
MNTKVNEMYLSIQVNARRKFLGFSLAIMQFEGVNIRVFIRGI